MEFTSAAAAERFDAFVAAAAQSVVGLDFDGVLAPIVDDPGSAHIHEDAADALLQLADVVRAIAVITGRPARQAIALGNLDELGAEIVERGKELFVFGQYGNERWSSTNRRVVSPRPPHGLSSFERELPAVLRGAGATEAYVEHKGLAVAVHLRRLPDPDAAFEALLGPMGTSAETHGLALEPGRHVIEVRSAGMHKGHAVRTFAAEQSAGGFMFVGDDLGDVVAFEAVRELRDEGLATLLVYSASDEQAALMHLADVVVQGPDGVMGVVREVIRAAADRQA